MSQLIVVVKISRDNALSYLVRVVLIMQPADSLPTALTPEYDELIICILRGVESFEYGYLVWCHCAR